MFFFDIRYCLNGLNEESVVMQQIVGFLFGAGLFINAALFIPQIVLLLKQKHADDISFTLFFGFACIQSVTIAHGYFVKDYILIVGYSLSLAMCLTISWLIFYYRSAHNKKITLR